jgi:hypothetical protein
VYEDRIKLIQESFQTLPTSPFVELVSSTTCSSKSDLEKAFSDWKTQGGSNIVLKKAKSYYYTPSATMEMTDFDTSVAQITSVDNNKEITCKLPNGNTVKVDCSAMDINNLAVGTIITFKKEANSMPILHQVRGDLDWYSVSFINIFIDL